uniref:NADH-ubiquinone oxidoreductase chain 1 n=1 Tax=Rhipicentor nuttalli TaxID=72856 RepID=A0A3G2JZW8_9ACAR|nr:NADH dehydrogenase subunit 1 [Rhipicentor nuttalli]AYN50579.1 NADH dehydrogenase subunit 1 [Rhipicentor nuttalli]
MLDLIYFMLLILMVLLSVAFFTLMERKILGYCHIRKGPNKTGMMGFFQPFSDALKLFSKEMNVMFYMNKMLQFLSPLMMMMMMMMMMMVFNFYNNAMNLNLSLIFFICISGMSSYTILLSGWTSNSKYSLIGAYRGFAQVISYEVSMAMILISLAILPEGFNFMKFMNLQEKYSLMFSFIPIFFIWILTILAELNRVPFDLSEGESELVSGFNIEYGSWLFAIIFMSEYGSIMIISYITNYLFLGMKMEFLILMLMMLFILIRGTYPRMRYDQLMMMAWKIILPLSMIFLFLTFLFFYSTFRFICINFWN